MFKFKGIVLVLSVLVLGHLFASKPKKTPSLSDCEDRLLVNNGVQHDFAYGTYVTLNTVLDTKRSPYLAKLWLDGERAHKASVSAGLSLMYDKARDGSLEIIDKLRIKKDQITQPVYDKGNFIDAAIETHRLIRRGLETKAKNLEYIREAVIMRDGVLAIVPLLKRVLNSSGQAYYLPVAIRGHQKLENDDILMATAYAWILGEFQSFPVDEVLIYLSPLISERERGEDSERKLSFFKFKTQAFLPVYLRIYRDFIRVVMGENAPLLKKFNLKPSNQVHVRRNTEIQTSFWWSIVKKFLHEEKSLSMMPLPPTPREEKKLAEAGFDTMIKLSKLDPNKDEFLKLCINTGISTLKMFRYWARAKAITLKKPLLVKSLSRFGSMPRVIIHTDYENDPRRDRRSGTFLFGITLEKNAKIFSRKTVFVGDYMKNSKELVTEQDLERTWASYLREVDKVIKSNPEALITIYSKHEHTLFEQQFDILIQDPALFSDSERSSSYYFEFENENEVRHGALVRNTEFFKKNKDLTVKNIAVFFQKTLDLLSVSRNNVFFPVYTNSIKTVLPYTSAPKESLYKEGENGLEAMAWFREWDRTRNKGVLEKLKYYVLKDTDANYYLYRYFVSHSKEVVDTKFLLKESTLKKWASLEKYIASVRSLDVIQLRYRYMMSLFPKQQKLSQWKVNDLLSLVALVNREDYLEKIEALKNQQKSHSQIEMASLFLKYSFLELRNFNFQEFVKSMNKGALPEMGDEAYDGMVYFLGQPITGFLAMHVYQLLIYEMIEDFRSSEGALWNQMDLSDSKSIDSFYKNQILPLFVEHPSFPSFKSEIKKVFLMVLSIED